MNNITSLTKLHHEMVAVAEERNNLRALCAQHGVCTICGQYYTHHYTEPFATCECHTSEWYKLTEHMELQRELVALRERVEKAESEMAMLQSAAQQTAPSVPEEWRKALQEAQDTFQRYADLHRAKDTRDGHEKANANQKLANKLYAMLQSIEGYSSQAQNEVRHD